MRTQAGVRSRVVFGVVRQFFFSSFQSPVHPYSPRRNALQESAPASLGRNTQMRHKSDPGHRGGIAQVDGSIRGSMHALPRLACSTAAGGGFA